MHGAQVGLPAEDEWMNEYRDMASRSKEQQGGGSARPGMAPEEEALLQVCLVHIDVVPAAQHYATAWVSC